MTSRIEQLRHIRIPAKDMGRGFDTIIEVTPRDDRWLLSKERTWEEIDRVLEGRLQGIQPQLTDFEGEPSSFAKNYGLERPAGGNMARFLAYAGMVDEYRLVEESSSRAAENIRQRYEEEKQGLREKMKPSSGKYQASVWELRARCEPEIVVHSDKAKEAEDVKNLILRKAVMDVFSVENNATETGEPLAIQQFIKLISEAREAMAQSPTGFKERDPISYFGESLAGYLRTTRDTGLFSKYSYRYSPDIIRNLKDCEVLENVLGMAVGKSNTGDEIPELQPLGDAFIKFLVNRASYLSSVRGGECHYLPLMCDLITAAGYCNKTWVLEGISSVVDRNFNSLVASGKLDGEVKQTLKRWGEQWETMYRRTEETLADSEVVSEEVKKISMSSEYQFLQLATINSLIESYSDYLNITKLKSVVRLRSQFVKEGKKYEKWWSLLIEPVSYLANQSCECSMSGVLAKLCRVVTFPIDEGKMDDATKIYRGVNNGVEIAPEVKISAFEKIQKMKAQVNEKRTREMEAGIINYYLACFFDTYHTTSEEVSRENKYLWDQVLNNPIWFVSPRGDRFRVERDPELAEYAIEALTFRIDPAKPREHQVQLTIGGLDEPITFWLDTKGNLLDYNRALVVFDPVIKERFENVVLKRMYTITSGLLREDSERTGVGEFENGRDEMYRRAHYRVLSSTERRKITMESYGAQVHAGLIKKIYGIDIFEEARRRRAIGTLRQDQYLTFVQESVPTVRGKLMLPNELRYDPELVVIS